MPNAAAHQPAIRHGGEIKQSDFERGDAASPKWTLMAVNERGTVRRDNRELEFGPSPLKEHLAVRVVVIREDHTARGDA